MMDQISESEYRKIDLLSYSAIKEFVSSRNKFYKRYILGEKIDDKSSSMNFGSLIHTLLLRESDFNDNYHIITASKPTGQMGSFVDVLFRLTKENTNEFNDLCQDLERLIEMSYVEVGFQKKKLETVKNDFLINKIGYDYYVELQGSQGLIPITSEDLQWALVLVDWIKTHRYTSFIFDLEGNPTYEVYNELQLTTTIEGELVKLMVDKLILNKVTRKARILDFKIGAGVDSFPYQYLKMGYYIQNGVYTTGVRENFPDFEVPPMNFIPIDRKRQTDPVLVTTTEGQYRDAMMGFTIGDRFYKGVNDCIKAIREHKSLNIWSSSIETISNNGIIPLNVTTEPIEEE